MPGIFSSKLKLPAFAIQQKNRLDFPSNNKQKQHFPAKPKIASIPPSKSKFLTIGKNYFNHFLYQKKFTFVVVLLTLGVAPPPTFGPLFAASAQKNSSIPAELILPSFTSPPNKFLALLRVTFIIILPSNFGTLTFLLLRSNQTD